MFANWLLFRTSGEKPRASNLLLNLRRKKRKRKVKRARTKKSQTVQARSTRRLRKKESKV